MKPSLAQLQRIWKSRNEWGCTQTAVADRLGVTVGTLSRKLRGQIPITVAELDRLGEILNFEIKLTLKRG